MLQQRKKDYLLRLIEELFKKLQQLMDSDKNFNDSQKLSIIEDCYHFFTDTFDVKKTDSPRTLIEKISDNDLLEQYAKLLLTENQLLSKDKEKLITALEITEYLQDTDISYSWERTILREDILRELDKNNE